jgi:hypothetical protein
VFTNTPADNKRVCSFVHPQHLYASWQGILDDTQHITLPMLNMLNTTEFIDIAAPPLAKDPNHSKKLTASASASAKPQTQAKSSRAIIKRAMQPAFTGKKHQRRPKQQEEEQEEEEEEEEEED